jgi:hypothetical protein
MAKWYNPLSWWRYIPHPKYGNYGGRDQTCVEYGHHCPLPVDWADTHFKQHDRDLEAANSKKGLNKLAAKYRADRRLGRNLWKGKLSKLKYKSALYRNTYVVLSRIIFFRP